LLRLLFVDVAQRRQAGLADEKKVGLHGGK
jgi:hypothetical protein